MIRVFGQITDASGKGVAGAMIELRALKSSTEVLYGSVFTYKCDASGHYEFPLAIGAYDAYAQNDICGDMDYLGTAVVTADTDDGGLHHILVDGGINITPPMLDTAMEFALRAEKAATSAKSDRIQTGKDVIVTGQNKQVAETKAQESATSADEAKAARDSIVQDANEVRHNTQQVADNAASVASNTALVQRKAEQVAQNTQTVTTKTQQVSENAQAVAANTQAVTLMRDEVVAKTSMAQAAADTATQKAASAAEHDAAAAEYARQAQEAAQATAGALIDGGAADLSTGVYPQPVQVSGTARPTFWKVTKGGTVGGVDYGVGDTLIYTVAGSGSYYKIDNTESVTSVQGEKGAVTLTPEKIGAESAGTAAAIVLQHVSASDPHAQYAKTNELAQVKQALSEVSISLDELKGDKLIKFGGGAVPAGSSKVFLRVHSNKTDAADFLLMGKLIVHENGVKNIYQVYVGGNSRWGVAGRAPIISFNSIQMMSRPGHVSSKVELSMLTDGIDDGIVRLNLSNNDSTYQIYFDFYVEWFTCSGHVEKITSSCTRVTRVSSIINELVQYAPL
ncbi:prophage tail fiber N-terminal domain-containing protein [Plesiomonas shigelloides]|uniref:prophage tail fiber N-terminal domain-containing protein n=1 Tax=Plesiomonas shigelloides TaxID=703 RepID=UPI00387EF9B6